MGNIVQGLLQFEACFITSFPLEVADLVAFIISKRACGRDLYLLPATLLVQLSRPGIFAQQILLVLLLFAHSMTLLVLQVFDIRSQH